MKHHAWAAIAGLLSIICFCLNPVELSTNGQTTQPAYKDVSLPIEKRVNDLVSRMTLAEKVSQMMNAHELHETPRRNHWGCLV